MNAVRYYLALCILVSHFNTLGCFDIPTLPRIFGGAGSFFALSGFLMFPSYEKRPDAERFFKRRARRIFPAYFLVVIVAAILCVFISTLSPVEYFSSAGFWKYIAANITFMNFLAPDLPGVFTSVTNNISAVNGALWTMKGEIMCYLSVPLSYILINKYGSAKRVVSWIMIISGALTAILLFLTLTGKGNYEVIQKQFFVFMLFYMGALINLNLQTILRYKWFIIGIDAVFLTLNHFSVITLESDYSVVIYTIFLGFVTGTMVILCSIIGKWGRVLSHHNAVSYDIYLFHYPIIQTAIFLNLSGLCGVYTTLAIVISITIVCALLSWKFVGKPILDYKGRKIAVTERG